MDSVEAVITLVGTPIGNLEDITLRALRILSEADVLACEDTRVTRKLFQRHNLPVPKTLVVLNDHTERKAARYLVKLAAEGKRVAFCSDAGMPGISDPGFNLLREAEAAGVGVDVIPGPSAVTTAVALAGIPAASFTFLGFPPRRDGRLARIFAAHAQLPPALVLYESPRRLGRLLSLASEHIAGDRRAAVCLELTKKFQRVEQGSLAQLAERFSAGETRGEAVLVIAGADRKKTESPDEEDAGDSEEF